MSGVKTRFISLIRTHHITSRKKLQRVKKAAIKDSLPYVLIRSGGSPGLMYAESADVAKIDAWVAFVKNLRYKDFQCPRRPALNDVQDTGDQGKGRVFKEVGTVAEFAEIMERKGLGDWGGITLLLIEFALPTAWIIANGYAVLALRLDHGTATMLAWPYSDLVYYIGPLEILSTGCVKVGTVNGEIMSRRQKLLLSNEFRSTRLYTAPHLTGPMVSLHGKV
ncbi:hypothetical protein F4778DRAFT_794745 [Xylariomycetidae sp. FL2044]|nr:hypothetical protein F4778DRAFT_794745 [Xylariomycetidae sp. FL2044]